MSKSNTFENDVLNLIFNNTAIAGIGDSGGLLPSAAPGSLYVSLHTADPGETGTAVTSETAYTGYARVAVSRAGGFTVSSAGSVSPAANLDFPECTASPGSALSFFGIVSTASGAGKLLYSGALSPTITMAIGVIPRVKSTSTITED